MYPDKHLASLYEIQTIYSVVDIYTFLEAIEMRSALYEQDEIDRKQKQAQAEASQQQWQARHR